MSFCITVGYWQFFVWMTGAMPFGSSIGWDSLTQASGILSCWNGAGSQPAGSDIVCMQLMQATVLAMLVLPVTAFISGMQALYCCLQLQ